MLKRIVDIIVAGSLLVVTLPIIVISAILVKLDSKGPVFFRQSRMGREFTEFQLFKFRTMVEGSKGLPYTLGPDPRITRCGRWLRWAKFDELPQLWNVLRGEMSLVGPRPVIPALTREFRREYRKLLRARPGLTDPATLKYRSETDLLAMVPEPMRYFKTVVTPDKLRISLAYQKRATVWTDLGVLARTFVALVAPLWRQAPREAVEPGMRRVSAQVLSQQPMRGA